MRLPLLMLIPLAGNDSIIYGEFSSWYWAQFGGAMTRRSIRGRAPGAGPRTQCIVVLKPDVTNHSLNRPSSSRVIRLPATRIRNANRCRPGPA